MFLVTAIVVVVLAHTLAELTWRLLPSGGHAGSGAGAATAMAGGQETDTRRESIGEQVAEMGLFGTATPLGEDGAREVPVDAPDTRLDLTLRGVLYDPGDRLAMVIIAEGGRDENVYRVGDSLRGSVTIDAILQDRVILRREGRHETLRLPERQVERTAGADSDHLPGEDDNTGGRDDMRQVLLQNPDEFTTYVRPQPYMQDGEFRGFRLQPGSDPQIMQAVGLEPGDVVTAINGEVLDNPQQGVESLRGAAETNRLELTILRDGATQTVNIDFDN